MQFGMYWLGTSGALCVADKAVKVAPKLSLVQISNRQRITLSTQPGAVGTFLKLPLLSRAGLQARDISIAAAIGSSRVNLMNTGQHHNGEKRKKAFILLSRYGKSHKPL